MLRFPARIPTVARFLSAWLLASSLGCGDGGTGDDDTLEPTPDITATPSPTPVSSPTPTPTPAPPAVWPSAALEVPAELDPLFSLESVPAFRLRLTVDEWNGLLHDFDMNPRNEIYRQADLSLELDGEAPRSLPAVGFRLRGNTWSRVRPEVGEPGSAHDPANLLARGHFKIKFNEQFDDDESIYGAPSQDVPEVPANKGREVLPGVRTLNFKFNNGDPTYLREVASYDLFRRAGVQAPLAAYARLYVTIGDEAERYLGIFVMLEDLNKEWLERRYDDNGFLFKCLYQGEGPADLYNTDGDDRSDDGRIGIEKTDPADPLEASTWDSETSPYRPAYDLKTKEDDFLEAQDGLNDLISMLRSAPDRAELEALIDVEALLQAYAVNVYVGMSDDYWRLGNNYYLARRPTDDRWLFIPYDYDRTFGIATVGSSEASSSLIHWGSSRVVTTTQLMDRILAVPELSARWRFLLRALHSEEQDLFREAPLETRLAELQSLVQPYTTGYDTVDEYPFTADTSDLSSFIQTRLDVAQAEVPLTHFAREQVHQHRLYLPQSSPRPLPPRRPLR